MSKFIIETFQADESKYFNYYKNHVELLANNSIHIDNQNQETLPFLIMENMRHETIAALKVWCEDESEDVKVPPGEEYQELYIDEQMKYAEYLHFKYGPNWLYEAIDTKDDRRFLSRARDYIQYEYENNTYQEQEDQEEDQEDPEQDQEDPEQDQEDQEKRNNLWQRGLIRQNAVTPEWWSDSDNLGDPTQEEIDAYNKENAYDCEEKD